MPIPKLLLGATRQVAQTGETGWGPETTQILLDIIDSNNIKVQKLSSGALVSINNVATHAALAAAGTITPTATVMRVVSSGGAVVLDTTTPIAAGQVDEQQLEIWGTDNVNTVEIRDSGNVDLNGLIILSLGTHIHLAWDSAGMVWREKSRNN